MKEKNQELLEIQCTDRGNSRQTRQATARLVFSSLLRARSSRLTLDRYSGMVSSSRGLPLSYRRNARMKNVSEQGTHSEAAYSYLIKALSYALGELLELSSVLEGGLIDSERM